MKDNVTNKTAPNNIIALTSKNLKIKKLKTNTTIENNLVNVPLAEITLPIVSLFKLLRKNKDKFIEYKFTKNL